MRKDIGIVQREANARRIKRVEDSLNCCLNRQR